MTRLIGGIVCIVALAGCATGYQKQGVNGGFSESRLDENTLMVSFAGNVYTQKDIVQRYMFYRCAEATLEYGFDYFVLLGTDGTEQHSTYQAPGQYVGQTSASAYGSGNYAYGNAYSTGTYYPGATIPMTKHGASAAIKMFRGQKPGNNPAAFDAHEVVRYMGPSIPGAKVPASTTQGASEIDEPIQAEPAQPTSAKAVAVRKTEARWLDAAEFSAQANGCTASLRMISADESGNELYESACSDGKKLKMQCVQHGCVVRN